MHITNNTKDFYRGATRRRLRVVDSRSAAYKTSISDSWLQRIWQEFKDTEHAGGRSLFFTLTYNDWCMPKYKFKDRELKDTWFPCFSKRDKDRFIAGLRKRWSRAGIEVPFKYIFVNEYGVTTGCSHRPHYHCIFFLPKEILDYEGCEETHWKELIQDFWQRPYHRGELGFAMWSPKKSIWINSEFAPAYVSKYMFKDDNLLRNDKVKEYVEIYGSLPNDGKRKGSLTSHWQSQHFGESLINVFNGSLSYYYGRDFHFSSELSKGISVRHKVPLYIERKLNYDYNKKDNRYLLNMRGLECRLQKFYITFDNLVSRYGQYFNFDKLSAMLPQSVFDDQNHKISIFDNCRSLFEWLKSIFYDNFLQETCLYQLVWEGSLVDSDTLENLMSWNYQEFFDASVEQYKRQVAPHLFFPWSDYHSDDGVFKNRDYTSVNYDDLLLGTVCVDTGLCDVDDCSRFDNCSFFLDCIEDIDNIYRSLCFRKYMRDREERKLLKFHIS